VNKHLYLCHPLVLSSPKWNTIFLKPLQAFACGIGEYSEWEGGGRILLDDNTGGRAVMLRLNRLQCVGVGISDGLPCMGWTARGSNTGGGEIFRTRPDRL